ncbi:unnamed protein product [Spirodela intermedia]|uniref:Uncharacterized protein n=1 Tax=Spirodela intermedia TaxID=51605 RepID=A0A7I8L1V8_SPIIN|nr:unnamed protein product [Spirodela intermedia]
MIWTISRVSCEVKKSRKWIKKSSLVLVTYRLRRLSPGGAEKRRLCGSPAAVTWRSGAGWRWGACQGLHPQVCVIRGGSSSHLSIYHDLRLKIYYLLIINS